MGEPGLRGPDHFLDILDADLRRSGLPGNLAQLQLCLSAPPDRLKLEKRLVEWAPGEPACRVVLEDGLGWTRRSMKSSGTPPALNWHRNVDAGSVLARRMRTPLARPAAPPFVLDVIEGRDGTVLGLTWDHLLMDARGGEFLLARLAGQAGIDGRVWSAPVNCPPRQRLKALRALRPVFSRIGRGVAAPPAVAGPRFEAAHATAGPDESEHIAQRARGIHPLVGETALLLVGALRQTHGRCMANGEKKAGYVVPVSVSRRAPGSATPVLGNPISILYVLAEAAQMEDSTPHALARHIAGQIADALRHGLIEASEKQLGLFRYLPRTAGSLFMRRLMRGQMASCFFAHTGRTAFDTIRDFNFFGSAVTHVYHRPMVCQPPGLGFFACRHASRLHLAVCRTWPEDGNPARNLLEDLRTL